MMRLCLQASCFKNTFLFALLALLLTPSVSAQISGTVFRDFNANGVQTATAPIEPGLTGYTVTAYNSAGTSLGTGTVNASGVYSFTSGVIASGTKVRLEFTLPTGYYASNGSASNSTVQFVTAGAGVTANLGVNIPADYCQSTNPTYALPCYVGNAYNGSGSTFEALIATTFSNGSPYSGGSYPTTAPATTAALLAAGKAGTPANETYAGAPGTAANFSGYAQNGQIGTTWGTAYQRSTKQLFAAAFVKSNTDFGSLGIGGIYKVDMTSPSNTVSNFINLTAAPFNLSLGSVTRTLPTSSTAPYNDTDAFSKTGKVGLGGLEISDDDKTLWALVMGDNSTVTTSASTPAKLVKITIGVPATVPAAVSTYAVPTPGCIKGIFRAMALKYYKGKLYVGGVCSGELSGGTNADTKAIVYEFDPTTSTFTKVLDNTLNVALRFSWTDSWSALLGAHASAGTPSYTYGAELMLSDIDFDVDGSMILGFVDRSGFQLGYNNYGPTAGDTRLYIVATSGDLLKACKNAAGTLWSLEVNAQSSSVAGTCATTFGPSGGANNGQGPSGSGEFYWGDNAYTNYTPISEISNDLVMGGLALLNGSGQVLSTMSDPFDYNSAGISLFNNTTGLSDRRLQVLGAPTSGSSPNGKANGLGEPSLLCDPQPIEIGNRVWTDTDKDGIQDPDELGISGVTVDLYEGTTKVGTTTTGSNGDYFFTNSNVNLGGVAGLKPDSTYQIRIGTAQAPLSTLTLTTANVGANDLIDNDATTSGSNAIINVTLTNAGENNHSLDFGFQVRPTFTFTATSPTCTGSVAANNGKITLTAKTNADKYGVSTGATYTGVAYTAATVLGTVPPSVDVQTSIPNTGGTYTIRVFNGSNTNYKDTTITIYPIVCASCPRNIVYICGLEKPLDAPAFDHGMITYLKAIGHTVQPAQVVAGGLQDPSTSLIIKDGSNIPITIDAYDKIIVSHSAKNELTANTGSIVTKLRNTVKPVLMMTRVGTDVMGMANTIGFINGIGDIWIENNTSSILPSGLPNGSLTVMNNPTLVSPDGFQKSLNYAQNLGSGAVVGAYLNDYPADDRVIYYGYPVGATLADGSSALGRRFFIGFKIDGASSYSPEIAVNDPTSFFTANGQKMLDAALQNTCPCCPTITSPSATQTICVGATGSNITVNTNQNAASSIKFVKFTTDQSATNGTETAAELTAIYAGTAIGSAVTPTGASNPYTATYTWNSTDFPNAGTTQITYYVYAILNPDAGVTCRPTQEIKVVVNPTPSVSGSITATKATCNGALANNNAHIDMTGLVGVDKIAYSTSGSGSFTYAAAQINNAGSATAAITGLPNPASATTYTLRLYNTGGTCYIDQTVVVNPTTCVCPPTICTPVAITRQ